MATPFPASLWVLVVEDQRDQAELCSDICAEAGLNAMTAATGAAGVDRARDTEPVLILLDVMLPDIDGWEVCRRLKADDRTKHIPIVMLTARDDARAARRAREAGCAAYLPKPCPPDELVAVMKRIVSQRAGV
jgi:two-component system, cell cycle response regulator DivK